VAGLVGQAHAPDVAALAVVEVETAEHEPVLDGVQLADAFGVPGVEGVALGPSRRGRDDRRPADLVERARGAGAEVVQVRVQVRDVRLFGVDLGLDLGSAQGRTLRQRATGLLYDNRR
jgi:hypothetical protein